MPRFFLLVALVGAAAPSWASDATVLRLYLADGTALVSYGEFARVDDRVVFSMPIGGTKDQPRLHMVSIPTSAVDWPRTERYGASARYQYYAVTRGEEGFAQVTAAAARVLSEIAASTEPARALAMAMQARALLARWPSEHYGYRQRDVAEIVALLDEAVADLRVAAGVGAMDLTLVANAPEVALEPLLGMPGTRDMLQGMLSAAELVARPAERVSLLESALWLLKEAGATIPNSEVKRLARPIEKAVRQERDVDARYGQLSRKLLRAAGRHAADAKVRDIEKAVVRLPAEDARLGRLRPEVIGALGASLQMHLDAARRLRLRLDQWSLRRDLYRDYQRAVGSQIVQLVKTQPALDAIRRLEGPEPAALLRLRSRLAGGAEALRRRVPPLDLVDVHGRLVGAWRFAEQAVAARSAAVSSADLSTAWEASSAAAAALMLLDDAQRELRSFVEPPRIR